MHREDAINTIKQRLVKQHIYSNRRWYDYDNTWSDEQFQYAPIWGYGVLANGSSFLESFKDKVSAFRWYFPIQHPELQGPYHTVYKVIMTAVPAWSNRGELMVQWSPIMEYGS